MPGETPNNNGNNKNGICISLMVSCAIPAQCGSTADNCHCTSFQDSGFGHQKHQSALSQPLHNWELSLLHPSGEEDCKDKVNLDNVTKPKLCPSFKHSSAPREELCSPAFSPKVSAKAPCNWEPAIPARIHDSFTIPLLHPSALVRSSPDTASCCFTYPKA